MVNYEDIIKESKREIKELLNTMGCYEFTDEGIDLWLKQWYEGCHKQIEDIAEKSPFYDGRCKIVFPSEYPREYDFDEVLKFSNWIYSIPKNNCVEKKINGFNYDAARAHRSALYNLIRVYNNMGWSKLEGIIGEIKNIISDNYEDLLKEHSKFTEMVANFEKQYVFEEKIYSYEDCEKYSIDKVYYLSQILKNKNNISQFVNKDTYMLLNRYFPEANVKVGQKLSRAINSIGKKYGFANAKGWEKAFANFADAVNPLNVTKWTVISWHPIDYLTFCFGNSWSSCCTIDKNNVRRIKLTESHSRITNYVNEDYQFQGDHSAAALSYMFDDASFIYYTVNHKYDGNHYELEPKQSRIVFATNEDYSTLLETRLYPQCNDDSSDDSNYRLPREIVQKVICDAIDQPNLWKMKSGVEACCDSVKTRTYSVHYDDFRDERNKKCNISWRGENPKMITIGHKAICPSCGCTHSYIRSLNCEDCDPMYGE